MNRLNTVTDTIIKIVLLILKLVVFDTKTMLSH